MQMKPNCERCAAPTPWGATAYVCSFECTFCETCARAMDHVCPNCAGELLRRPRRDEKDSG